MSLRAARLLGAAMLGVVLAGCQDGYSITFNNQCESDIQIRPRGTEPSAFRTVPAGGTSVSYGFTIEEEHRVILSVGADPETVLTFNINELEDFDGRPNSSGTLTIEGEACG